MPLVVRALLLVARREVEVDQRRGVDVDVVELGGDRFVDQRLERLHLRRSALRRRPLLGAGLEVIALDEDRAAEPLAHRRGEDAGGVFARPLLGVADLGAGDLEDERAGVVAHRRAEERARRRRRSARGC